MTAVGAWLDAAQARADAATPGPWFPHDCGQGCCVWVNNVEESTTDDPEDIAGTDTPETADFIAAARTDLPDAIAALRAVRSAAADLAHRGGALGDRHGGNGSIVAQQNEGRGQGYREAARLIESAIASVLGVSES